MAKHKKSKSKKPAPDKIEAQEAKLAANETEAAPEEPLITAPEPESQEQIADIDTNAANAARTAEEPPEMPAPSRKKRKKRARRRLNYVRRLTLLVCSALLIFSGYNLIKTTLEYKIGDDMYADIEQSFVSFPSAEPTASPKGSPTPTPENLHDLPGVSMDIPQSPQISFVEDYAPDIWPNVDFDGLRGVNADTEAWILCVGTNINYPVVHSHDNEDYLNKMFDGRTSKLGTAFVDMRNNWGFTDKNTIVYGHNMRNHSMFWTLTEYRYQAFYDEHPTLRLILPDGNYEIQVFAAVVTQAEETSFWDVWWKTDEDHAAWLDMVKRNSKIRTTPEVTIEDRIVTLSTCTYEYSDARCLVYGKLVAVG